MLTANKVAAFEGKEGESPEGGDSGVEFCGVCGGVKRYGFGGRSGGGSFGGGDIEGELLGVFTIAVGGMTMVGFRWWSVVEEGV